VVLTTSAEDVSDTVLFCKANNIILAVRGGGHSSSGASSSDGGLVIDLSHMKRVTVDPVKKTAIVGGGALWEHVDAALGVHGLATVGGTVNNTGVGGLTLGGGYGWLTPKYGLAVDNLLSVEIVLANGQIVGASEGENPDLFWAVRGAGAYFGVVTKFVFQAYEQKDQVFAGPLVFPKDKMEPIINFYNSIMDDHGGKAVGMMVFTSPPPAHTPVILVVAIYFGPEEEAKRYYEPLLSLEPIANMSSMLSYTALNSLLNAGSPADFRRTMKGAAFLPPLDPRFAGDVFEDYVAFIEQVPDAAPSAVLFEFLPAERIISVPQTATAFANRGRAGNIVYFPGWTKPEHDDECRVWTRTMAQKTKEELTRVKSMANGIDESTRNSVGEYVNYDGEHSGFCL